MSKKKSVSIGGITIHDVEGTAEEIADLKSLIDEALDRFYMGNKKNLTADLAQVIQDQICKCEGKAICSELIEALESSLQIKLAAVDKAEEFLIAIDEISADEEGDSVSADQWAENDCNKDPTLQLVDAHYTKK